MTMPIAWLRWLVTLRRHPSAFLLIVQLAGIGFGTALAITISWSANKSLLWAVIHGVLSWVYVVYYALVYHFK